MVDFQITGAQRLKAREPMTVEREVTDGVASLLNAADFSETRWSVRGDE